MGAKHKAPLSCCVGRYNIAEEKGNINRGEGRARAPTGSNKKSLCRKKAEKSNHCIIKGRGFFRRHITPKTISIIAARNITKGT
jgi:hypothetical protein